MTPTPTSTPPPTRSSRRGLRKRYGSTMALDGFDLAVERGHRARPARPERRGQDDGRALPRHPDDFDDGARRRSTASTCGATRRPCASASASSASSTRSTRRSRRGRTSCCSPASAACRSRGRGDAPTTCSRRSRWRMPPTARSRVLRRDAPTPRHRREPRAHARRSCSSTSRPPDSTRAVAPPSGRRSREVAAAGTTVLLTTQYLDEADQLADRISVMDHGRVIAEGTPRRAQAPHRRRPRRRGHPPTAPGSRMPRSSIGRATGAAASVDADTRTVTVEVADGAAALAADRARARRRGAHGRRPRPAPPHARRGVPAPHRRRHAPTPARRHDDHHDPATPAIAAAPGLRDRRSNALREGLLIAGRDAAALGARALGLRVRPRVQPHAHPHVRLPLRRGHRDPGRAATTSPSCCRACSRSRCCSASSRP